MIYFCLKCPRIIYYITNSNNYIQSERRQGMYMYIKYLQLEKSFKKPFFLLWSVVSTCSLLNTFFYNRLVRILDELISIKDYEFKIIRYREMVSWRMLKVDDMSLFLFKIWMLLKNHPILETCLDTKILNVWRKISRQRFTHRKLSHMLCF